MTTILDSVILFYLLFYSCWGHFFQWFLERERGGRERERGERERGREKERERQIDRHQYEREYQLIAFSYMPPLRIKPAPWACALTGDGTHDPTV